MNMQEDDLVLQITALKATKLPDHAPAVTPEEDAFARMEQTMPGAVAPEPAAQPTVAATRKRKPKGVATPAEVAAVVEAAQPVQPTPAKRGFGAPPRQAPVEQPVAHVTAPVTNGLGDAALAELEDVLAGFDDGEDEGGD
jgi:hypothetical protein